MSRPDMPAAFNEMSVLNRLRVAWARQVDFNDDNVINALSDYMDELDANEPGIEFVVPLPDHRLTRVVHGMGDAGLKCVICEADNYAGGNQGPVNHRPGCWAAWERVARVRSGPVADTRTDHDQPSTSAYSAWCTAQGVPENGETLEAFHVHLELLRRSQDTGF